MTLNISVCIQRSSVVRIDVKGLLYIPKSLDLVIVLDLVL